ncbi:MAG: ribulokinase [Verrucomicrobiota bacterium]
MATYTLGIDYGTNSVRALVVNTANGQEAGAAVANYPSGTDGILLHSKDHNLARQSPVDYVVCLERVIKAALRQARRQFGVQMKEVIGIGVDTTGSTPIPVDAQNQPMCLHPKYKKNLNAYAWLWKDHTAFAEAARITAQAQKTRPHFLAKCGGVYSSEWYWAKLWHCLNVDRGLFEATHAWIELEDYIPAVLCGVSAPEDVVRGICAAGHKAMFNHEWGGLPDAEFLASLDPRLAPLRERMPSEAFAIDHQAGRLTKAWAVAWDLPEGLPVAVGAFDAHLGAVGAGIKTGTLVKIIGTSTCDIMVAKNRQIPDIPGVCGIVDGSVLPGYIGIEAGQSAVGDIFRWFVTSVCQGHDALQIKLTAEARRLKPGASGLLALDWNNGNRTILVDPQLTGLLVGLTLHTTRAEIYRALLEATAFGALTIINRIEEYGVPIERVVCCGGIAEKNELFMQIYADVLNRPMFISRSCQTCALGAAIAGALAGGAYPAIEPAIEAMTGVKRKIYRPIPEHVAIYRGLYKQYKVLHDAFGAIARQMTPAGYIALAGLMKNLLALKQKCTPA